MSSHNPFSEEAQRQEILIDLEKNPWEITLHETLLLSFEWELMNACQKETGFAIHSPSLRAYQAWCLKHFTSAPWPEVKLRMAFYASIRLSHISKTSLVEARLHTLQTLWPETESFQEMLDKVCQSVYGLSSDNVQTVLRYLEDTPSHLNYKPVSLLNQNYDVKDVAKLVWSKNEYQNLSERIQVFSGYPRAASYVTCKEDVFIFCPRESSCVPSEVATLAHECAHILFDRKCFASGAHPVLSTVYEREKFALHMEFSVLQDLCFQKYGKREVQNFEIHNFFVDVIFAPLQRLKNELHIYSTHHTFSEEEIQFSDLITLPFSDAVYVGLGQEIRQLLTIPSQNP